MSSAEERIEAAIEFCEGTLANDNERGQDATAEDILAILRPPPRMWLLGGVWFVETGQTQPVPGEWYLYSGIPLICERRPTGAYRILRPVAIEEPSC